jgi:hypothetical protein
MQTDRMNHDRMVALTNSALRKIDRNGRRGLTGVSLDEVKAMALTIVAQADQIQTLLGAQDASEPPEGDPT